MKIRLQQGELREVGIEVTSKVKQDFVIDAATFTLSSVRGEVIEDGFPMIEGKKLIALFNAQTVGNFYITFKYHIGPEILIAKVLMEVV